MKKAIVVTVLSACVCLFTGAGFAGEGAKGKSGEELYKEHCAVCHPDGGNIINPQKTLNKKELDANKIKSAADIVAKMRNPGPGMTKFDKKMISAGDAKKIATYILNTFK